MPPRRILYRGDPSRTKVKNSTKGNRARQEFSESSHPQHQAMLSEEEVDSNIPIRRATKDGRDRDKEIGQLREDIRSLEETMRNYMAKNARPQGLRCHNHPRQA